MGIRRKLRDYVGSQRYARRAALPPLHYAGLKIPVGGAHITRELWDQIRSGEYESPEILAVSKLIQAGDTVLELGAGIGVVSAVAAQSKPGIRIEAYEANPNLIPAIEDLHKINGIGGITVHNEILLPNPSQSSHKFNLHHHFTEGSINDTVPTVASVIVPVRDFNQVMSDLRPDVFICDIEGAEEQLFVDIDLSSLRVIVLEIHPHLISAKVITSIDAQCAKAGLFPNKLYSTAQVVAYERRRAV